MYTKTIITLAASAAIFGTAHAQPDDDINFTYQAHELQTAGGMENLYDRLIAAAENACSSPGKTSIDARNAEKECIEDLAGDFIRGINHPRLTQLYESDGGSVFIAQK